LPIVKTKKIASEEARAEEASNGQNSPHQEKEITQKTEMVKIILLQIVIFIYKTWFIFNYTFYIVFYWKF